MPVFCLKPMTQSMGLQRVRTGLSDFTSKAWFGLTQILVVLEPTCSGAGDLREEGSIPGSGDPRGGIQPTPVFSSACNFMDRGAEVTQQSMEGKESTQSG